MATCVRRLLERKAEGVAIMTSEMDPELIGDLARRGIPIVFSTSEKCATDQQYLCGLCEREFEKQWSISSHWDTAESVHQRTHEFGSLLYPQVGSSEMLDAYGLVRTAV